MEIHFSHETVKVIQGLDRTTKQRIKTAIDRLPNGDVKSLKGARGSYRLRVGNWRILFSYPDNDTILIEKIGPRGQIYREV